MHEFINGLIGLAVGDALGLPLINISRDKLLDNPVTDLIAGGEYNVSKGTWGIPTQLCLAVRDSFLKINNLNEETIMYNLKDLLDGKYALNKGQFDVGKTTKKAIDNYLNGIEITKCGLINLNENGSGALMMMYPVAYYAYSMKLQEKEIYDLVKKVTELTHNHEINVIGCYIYTMYLIFLLRGKDKYASLSMLQCCDFSFFKEEYLELYENILEKSLKDISIEKLKTDGYIVSTVEASLYVLLNSNNYPQSVIGAINLGGKTNVISSIVGCMASILYGVEDIPNNWIDSLLGKDILDEYK